MALKKRGRGDTFNRWLHGSRPRWRTRMNRSTPRIAASLAFSIVAGSFPAPVRSAAIEEERFYFSEIPSVGSVGFFRMSKAKAPGAILTTPGADLDVAPARTLAEVLQQRVPSAVLHGQEYGGPSFTVRGVRSRVNYMRNGQL